MVTFVLYDPLMPNLDPQQLPPTVLSLEASRRLVIRFKLTNAKARPASTSIISPSS